MSVIDNTDPGRLEAYRPRADGLMGRCLCGSILLHLLFACLLLTVRLPEPRPLPRRRYRITEVRLLPREARPRPAAAQPEPVAEDLGPRDLSLFLNDFTPVNAVRHHRSRHHGRHHKARPTALAAPELPSELKPEAAQPGSSRSTRLGPQLAEGLPHLLERPMSELHPIDPAASEPQPSHGGAPSARPAAPAISTVRRSRSRSHHAPVADRTAPAAEPEAAPRPVQVARADVAPPLADVHPRAHSEADSLPPIPAPALPAPARSSTAPERPVEFPAAGSGGGKRIAQLPGNLLGTGSGLGPGPSRKEASLPEGRPGAAAEPGPRRHRMSHSMTGTAAAGGNDLGGITPIPAAGGVPLPDEERPSATRHGGTSDEGFGGKSTPVASLPSTGPSAGSHGSGVGSHSDGMGGGYGSDGPRSFGGGDHAGTPHPLPPADSTLGGDGSGGKAAVSDAGIDIKPGGSAGGGASDPDDSGSGSSDGSGHGTGGGKHVGRAHLPAEAGDGGGRPAPHRSGKGSGSGDDGSGPRSFDVGNKRPVSTGHGIGDGEGSGRGSGKDQGDSDGDGKGVDLPGGSSGDNDGPGQDGAGDSDTGFKKGRTRPAGVYVSTTGNYTLPGVIHDGDYHYNSGALRKIMDELNSRTKVKVQLGGRYESIAPGSFRRAPVIVFTGHKAFELTDEQRQLLKQYVDHGGMIWADCSHAAFDDAFRDEMEKIFGKRPSALSSSHPIYRAFYVLHGPPPSDLGDAEPFEGITMGDRLGVVITPNRYFSTVTGGLNAGEEVQEGAIQAVVNIYMYAAGNYRAVKDAGD